ncbi:MAG: hypothetical protein H6636_06545 [Anaerolineales bacterium]|nr:hypothetical protein [Anaerolineales bacterium]
MKKYFAIVIYRCYIESEYTGDIDFSCRYYEKNSIDEVRLALQEEKVNEYKNNNGERVTWVFDELIQIDEVENFSSGDEITGFICNESKFIRTVSENELEIIRQRYGDQEEGSGLISQAKKDLFTLFQEITRLKALVDKTQATFERTR